MQATNVPSRTLFRRVACKLQPVTSRNQKAIAAVSLHVRHVEQVRLSEESCNEGIARLLVELARATDLGNSAILHDSDAIGQGGRLVLIMRDVQDGRAERSMELADFVLHLLAQVLVEGAERLIHQQQAGIVDSGASKSDALLLPARKLLGPARAEMRQANDLEHALDPSGDLAGTELAQAQRKRDVLEYRHVREERVALKHHAEIALVRGNGHDILAIELDAPSGGRQEAGDRAKQRRLA